MRKLNKYKVSNFPTSNNHKLVSAACIDLILLMGRHTNDNIDEDSDEAEDGRLQSLSTVLQPNKPYTIGRSKRHAQLIIKDPFVSKRHCQLFFDASLKKIYILNGALKRVSSNSCNCDCLVGYFRERLNFERGKEKEKVVSCCCDCECVYRFESCLNGLFVNGVSVSEGSAVELCVGDEVMLVCASRNGVCGLEKLRIGFVVRRVLFQEEVVVPGWERFRFERPLVVRPMLSRKVKKRVFALRVSDSEESHSLECGEVVERAKALSTRCKRILRSSDPVSCIRRCLSAPSAVCGSYECVSKEENVFEGFKLSDGATVCQNNEIHGNAELLAQETLPSDGLVVKSVENSGIALVQTTDIAVGLAPSRPTTDLVHTDGGAVVVNSGVVNDNGPKASELVFREGDHPSQGEALGHDESFEKVIPPPGKTFYLNRLQSVPSSSFGEQDVVSLPELLHPVNSILRMFIATFTSDIGWFLNHCNIPSCLPVTVACHNTERCWSDDPEKRSCRPFSDFPNLVVVYPPFPEVIAFGGDRKRQGVGCHHPKLFVLQREDSLRVIITSANLVTTQWNNITNTVWWQDFPRRSSPNFASLFGHIQEGNVNNDSNCDFAAQLAGFMATLMSDVPSQAHWIIELSKYDFTGANAYLVASIPGLHSYRRPSANVSACISRSRKGLLGSVEAFVVGLSHLFRVATDSNGVQLKKLAAYLGKSAEIGSGMSEVILKREKNIPADANAVCVLVQDPLGFSEGDCVQLGFLPRTIASWVSPLWDMGLVRFSGFVCSRDALAAAFGENNIKLQLILHVFQGPKFQEIPDIIEPEHVVAFCSFVASVQRCVGLWRLEEVLHQFEWPEHLETDFTYGASSIGTSVSAQFLAAFSSAAGKKSQQLFDSEESDPEWGCWTSTHELKNPSIQIVFPTIERVKSAACGILPSSRILCFAEKTWQRLQSVGILHDAVPHSIDRVGHPMHVKVVRRRFQSKASSSSFGWVYCGSHNMSASAWGRETSSRSEKSKPSRNARLHVCNYELGVILVFPPPNNASKKLNNCSNLEDIKLPFVIPAPKYGPRDRPATKRAMWDVLKELSDRGQTVDAELAGATEEMMEDEAIPDLEDDISEVLNFVVNEKEEEAAYADVLWSQVDSS